MVSKVLENARAPLNKSCGMTKILTLHPDGEKSQILSILTE